MKIKNAFDYYGEEYARGQEWADTLPEKLQIAIEECCILFAITARGSVWISEAGHGWELCGTRRDAREYLRDLAEDLEIE